MSERYSRLFSLPANLYAEGAPVIVAAGALLKDNQTGKVLAQLKLQSATGKIIKAAKVQITPFDTFGNPLDETTEKEFLDLSVPRDGFFGAKTPAMLPNASTRTYSVRVMEIAFADNTAWKDNGGEWKPLTAQKGLMDELKDAELVKQYSLTFGKKCRFVPLREQGLWFCTCGSINREDEEECHVCHNKIEKLQNVDFDALEAEKQVCLAEEARQKEEKERKEKEAKIAAKKARKKRNKILAIVAAAVAACIVIVILLNSVIIPRAKYVSAVKLMNEEQYGEAISTFEALNDYKDSKEKITECKNQIISSKYEKAMALMKSEKYYEAILLFETLNGYKDSENKAEECRFKLQISNIYIGKTIKFGYYEQDNNKSNGTEEIEWKVLEVNGNSALIISSYSIDGARYNYTLNDITWENSSLREWLNNDFLKDAFNSKQREMINTSTVLPDKNPKYDTYQGNATNDKVFLLSIEEAKKYFASNNARKCDPTKYVTEHCINIDGNSNNCWWLRTSGSTQSCAAYVVSDGSISYYGCHVGGSYYAVRPAMWISLDS